MNYKRAFQCKKCPQSNEEDGCPMWWEYMATNIQSGEEVLKKCCGYQALPMFLTEVIKASNRPAAEMGSMRNELGNAVERIPALLSYNNEPKLIEESEDGS